MNDHTPGLFDAIPGARNTDPQTSHLAAASATLRAGSQCARLLHTYGAQDNWAGMTDEEAAVATGLPARSCWWKRCSELRALGLIAPTGTTRTSTAGEQMQVCAVTADGMRLRAELGRGA